MDISWVSEQAKDIHSFFVSIFYILATILLVVGVLVEFFKMPIGGVPTFSQLVGRAVVAAILLAAYPQISNSVAAVADAIADKLGSISTFGEVLDSAGKTLKGHSWHWTSIWDSLISLVAYVVFWILYLTVYFFNAAIVYCLILGYIFSPLMIVCYILPQTAAVTGGLFKTLFEIATWKVVFCILGMLLWTTALHDFEVQGHNFITLLTLTLMLALSMLMTPIIVRNLISGTLSNIASQTAGLAAVGLSAGVVSPAFLAGAAQKGTAKLGGWALTTGGRGIRGGYESTKKHFSDQRLPDNVIPFPKNKPPKKDS